MRELLARGTDRVVSLIGPGGIGKSRLAIEVAIAARDLFPDGTYFVGLENVLEPALLLPTIAYTLGIRDNGEAVLEERISRALAGRHVLLVLDNFEQIVDVAPVLVRLYTVAPTASFLVTSRIVLRIRGEQVYDVRSLTTPGPDAPGTLERAQQSAAVALFVDRAKAAKPDVRAHGGERRRGHGHLPASRGAAAGHRARRCEAADADPGGHRGTPRSGACRCLTAAVRDLPDRHRTMRATTRLERRACSRAKTGICWRTSGCSPSGSRWTPSKRSAPAARGTAGRSTASRR